MGSSRGNAVREKHTDMKRKSSLRRTFLFLYEKNFEKIKRESEQKHPPEFGKHLKSFEK